MKKSLKIVYLFSWYSIKTSLNHRAGIVLFLTGKILRFTLFFLFMYRLLSQSGSMAGFDLNQTFIFFLTFNLLDSFVQMFFREVYRFRPLVTSGEFDTILTKPYHPFLRVLFGGVDILDILPSIGYLVLLIYFASKIPVVSLLQVFLYVLLFFNGVLISLGFHILVLALGIFTTQVDHSIMIYRDLSKMASLPINVYQEPLRSILLYVIPVGIMVTVPAQVLLGIVSTHLIVYSFVFSFVFLLFSLFLWQKGLMRYQSWGG